MFLLSMDTQIHYLDLPELIAHAKKYDFILIDENVSKLWGDKLDLNEKVVIQIEDAEKSKNFTNFQKLCEELIDNGVQRNSRLLAIGGGATGDLVGFVASCILRGVEWSVVPTTLLSMIDASIGGKVAINTKQGKNLVGQFHQPEDVYLCEDFLETLPKKEIESGHGELIKYAFLSDEIYRAIKTDSTRKQIIKLAVAYKKKIVEMDPKEQNLRRLLNLGHTFGHAIESLTKLPHGVCVNLGIKILLNLYYQDGLSKWDELCLKLDFSKESTQIPKLDLAKVWDYVQKDKKSENDEINLPLPTKNGIIIQKLSYQKLQEDYSAWAKQ
jgi:3-dehydroquinate synthase